MKIEPLLHVLILGHARRVRFVILWVWQIVPTELLIPSIVEPMRLAS